MNSLAAAPAMAPQQAAAPGPRAVPAGRQSESVVGNQALLRRLQPKLTIGAADDPLEREADAVASNVMRMPDPTSVSRVAPPRISRACAACGADEEIQPKSDGGDMAGEAAPGSVDETLRSPGAPLDAATRGFFEPRFGSDFGDVRVHTDAQAAESARSVGALAYTVGPHLVFASGAYEPAAETGRRLIAHELTHVVQQSGAPANTLARFQYGHANSCTMTHLNFIWPGHTQAKGSVVKAMELTDGRPLTTDVVNNLHKFFGKDAALPANVTKIHDKFSAISNALEQHYLYHCSKQGDSSDSKARPCKGQNAETDDSGDKDITLCFDDMSKWSCWWAAWLIVHENYHRAFGPGHTWEAGSLDKCIMGSDALTNVQLDLSDPDSYACFAVVSSLGQPAPGGCTTTGGGSSAPDAGAPSAPDAGKQSGTDGGAPVQRTPAPTQVSRACAACEAEEEMQAKSAGADMAGEEAPGTVDETLRSPGTPLDADTRGFFEPRFGADFGDVRVHTDAKAQESARSVGALAYTVGPHLVFGADRYAPGSNEGRQLLAHELTHVVQQGAGSELDDAVAQRQPDAAQPNATAPAPNQDQQNPAKGAPAVIQGEPISGNDGQAPQPSAATDTQQAPVQRAVASAPIVRRQSQAGQTTPAPIVAPTVSWSDYRPVPDKIDGMSAQTGYKWTSQGSVISIVFDPATSWSVAADQTDALLRHEQYHLNLAVVIVNKANAAAATMKTAALLKALDTTLKAQDRSYDIDTDHGANTRMQAMWEKDIDANVPQFPFS